MIVQTIEISLSKGSAPDLLAHVAETGREIEMIPDVEISADDYTAEIDTVKPDGTFTMTNCTIDENGHIIAPIVEQAVAVKGLCHYIIKIYNDDTVVYSACGSLWVDDHLVTDDMIESVAEVNGYRFPQDFATRDEIPEIDDDAITNDKTWSSQKIHNEFINLLPHYSLVERMIGFWVDNKPLYEKIILISGLPSSAGATDFPINEANITVVDFDGAYSFPDGTVRKWSAIIINAIGQVDNDYSIYAGIVYVNGASYVRICQKHDRSTATGFVCVRYTKTTD